MGGKKGIPHRKWSKAEKLRLVKLYLEEHISVREIGRQHSVEPSLVSQWTKKYLEEGEAGLEPKIRTGNTFAALHTNKGLTELECLRLTVAKQEVEIARLKKGYVVKGVGAEKEFVTIFDKNTK